MQRAWAIGIAIAFVLLFSTIVVLRRDSSSQQEQRIEKPRSAPSAPIQSAIVRPADAISPEPSPRASESTDESRLERIIIPRLLQQSSARFPHFPPGALNRFKAEEALGLREGRLIALVYPKLMERLASKVALDPARPEFERYYMMFILKYLTEAGNSRAASSLVKLADDQDLRTADRALFSLSPADRSCAYRDLYIKKCCEGRDGGFDGMAFSADPESVSLMNDLINRPLDSSSTALHLNLLAKDAMAKYRILASPDWQLKLADFILQEKDYPSMNWAIEAARRNSFRNLTDLLRQRLDLSFAQMESQNPSLGDGRRFSTPDDAKNRFQEQYINQGSIDGLPIYYDNALITQLELGGRLTELEMARLRTFGYGCDPKQRLEELLA